jgi:hypothetical protein
MKRETVMIGIVMMLMTWFVLCIPGVPAQGQEKMVTVPESSLTDKQKADAVQRDMSDRVQQYGKWVGIGREVGDAVNEGMNAVNVQANNFARTPVGEWTMFVIVFKVIGARLIRYCVGLGMFIVGIPIWMWSYRKYLPRKYVAEELYDPATGKRTSVKYGYGYGQISDSDDKVKIVDTIMNKASAWCVGHWIIFAVFTVAALIVMFAGD